MEYENLPEQLKAVIDSQETPLTHGLSRTMRRLGVELELNKLFNASKVATLDFCKGKKFENVQIGSGPHPIDGFVNLDLGFKSDITWDIREGLPFDDNSVDFIFSEHTLEHIDYPVSVKRHFKDLFRVLETGGKSVIGVPDGGRVARAYYEKNTKYLEELKLRWYKNRSSPDSFNTDIDILNYVFRDQDDDPTYTQHFWAYDEDKLFSLFGEAGFNPDEIRLWGFDQTIATPKRQWSSIYVEATK